MNAFDDLLRQAGDELRTAPAGDIDPGVPARRLRRRRNMSAGAVGVVLVVALVAGVNGIDDGDPTDRVATEPGVGRERDDSPSESGAGAATTTTTSTTTPPVANGSQPDGSQLGGSPSEGSAVPPPPDPTSVPAGGRPTSVVVSRTSGELDLVDLSTGQVVRTLDRVDVEAGCPEACHSPAAQVELAAGHRAVVFETCCEPAGPTAWIVPVAGGVRTQVAAGRLGSGVPPQGWWWIGVGGGVATAVELGGEGVPTGSSAELGPVTGQAVAAALVPRGSAFTGDSLRPGAGSSGALQTVDLPAGDFDVADGWQLLVASAVPACGQGLTAQLAGGDRLATVVPGADPAARSDDTTVRVLHPADASVVGTWDIDGGVADVSWDQSWRWLLVTTADGRLLSIDVQTGAQADLGLSGVVSADW